MTDNRPQELLGFSITGNYSRFTELQAEQYPLSQLLPVLQKVIDDHTVAEFGWTQYTPYFNDGEACIFHAYGVWVSTVEPSDSPDDDDYEDEYKSDKFAVRSYSWKDEELSPDHWIDLEKAIEGGHFYSALLETFGDPAEVTWSRKEAEFHIEYAEHG